MNLSLKLILAVWLLSIAMISTSEAGKFGGFNTKSLNNSFKSFSNRTFSPKNMSVPKVNNFKSAGNFSRNTSSAFKNSSSKFNPVKSLNTGNAFRNLAPVRNMSPVKSFNPVKGGGLNLGKSPIKNLNPIQSGKTPIKINPVKNLNPTRGLNPITNPGVLNPGLVKINPGALNPGRLKPTPGGFGTQLPPFNPNPGGTPPNPGGGLPPINPNPGGGFPPINPNPGGGTPPINPNPGGGNPPMNPNPPTNPNPPYCPPTCPPHYCPPGYWPRPIFLPSFNLYPPVYQPCVTTVCPSVVNQTVVADTPVQQAAEEPAQPALQLMVGKPASLEAQGLGNVAGSVVIEVGGIGLPTQVRSWTDKMLVIDVPTMGLNGPTPATMHLFDSNRKPLASIPVELIVPVETTPAVSSK